MTTTVRTRAALLIPGLTAAALSSFALAPAHAAVAEDIPSASYVGVAAGLDRVVPDPDGSGRRSAGSVYLRLTDGTRVEAFCIDFEKTVAKKGVYEYTPWTDATVNAATLGKVAYIAENHEEIGKPYADRAWETAAAQVAIWELTDNIDAASLGNTKFAKRVDALLAKAQVASAPSVDYELEGSKAISGEGDDSLDVVSGKITSATGSTVSGQTVTFVVDGETHTATTDDAGVASVSIPRADHKRTVAIAFTVDVPAGAVFTPGEGKQPMIAADGFTLARGADVTVAAYEAPTVEEETPTTSPTPTPEPTDEPTTPVQEDPTDPTKPTPTVNEEPTDPDPVVAVPTSLPTTGGPALFGLVAAALGLTGAGLWGRKRFKK